MDELIKAVQALQAGDADAFQTIYEKTYRQTRAHIRRYCDDEDQCEDFLQETYMQLYKNINQLEKPEALQGWLNTTAKRLVGRRAEKDNKLPTQTFTSLQDDDGNEPEFEDEREESNPELISDRKAVAEIVNQILEMLPKEQRDALMMVYGQKVTIKELAAQLQISENTIKSRLLQGRRKLMEHKADFRRLGVELPAVGIAALIAVTYEENLAAQAAAGAVSGVFLKNTAAGSAMTEGPGAAAASSRVSVAAEGTGSALSAASKVKQTAESTVSDIGAAVPAESLTDAAVSESVSATSLSSASIGAASSAASTATTTAQAAAAATATATATAAAAKAAGTGLAVKLIAGAAAVAVAGGIAAGVVTSKSHSDSASTPSTEIAAEISTEAASGDTQAAAADAGMPVDVELSEEEAAALNELYIYADEANNTDRYLADYLLNNYELIASIYDKLSDKAALYTGDGFVQGTTGTGVYLKSGSEIYVGSMKDGLPEGYGCLARLTESADYGSVDDNTVNNPTYIVPCIDGTGYSGYWAHGKANGHGYWCNIGSKFFNVNGLDLFYESTGEIIEANNVYTASWSKKESTFIDDLADGEYLAHSENLNYNSDRVIPVNNGQVDESRLGGSTFDSEDVYEDVKEYRIHWEQGSTTGYIVYPELGGLGNNCRWESRYTWNQSDSFIKEAAPVEFENGVYFYDLDVDELYDAAIRAGFDNRAAWHYLEKLSEAMNAALGKDTSMYGAELMPITDGNTITLKLEDYDGEPSPLIVFTYSAADDSCSVTTE